MPEMHISTFSLSETFDVGIDAGNPVSNKYRVTKPLSVYRRPRRGGREAHPMTGKDSFPHAQGGERAMKRTVFEAGLHRLSHPLRFR
jgi:hypothetical protein